MSPVRARQKSLPVPRLPLERFELACGARLIVSPRRGASVCAVQVHLRGGNSLDPAAKLGLAYLTGRLVDQGTRRSSEEELAARLEKAGGSLAGGATGISGQVANERWEVLLETLAECLTEPAYPRDKIERQRQRLIDRLVVDHQDPRTRGVRLFRQLVYGGHWLARPEAGDPATVRRIARADLARFHAANWCGKRALIVFCGDVAPEKVRRLLDRRLARFPAGRELGPPDLAFPPRAARAASFAAERQQAHVFLGHLGITRADPDYAALLVMDHVLGTGPGFTNRVARRLRDELGLAYTVHASISSSAGVLPGTFTAYIGTSPANLATAVAGFRREIERIQREPVPREELELARSYLLGSFVIGFERAARRVQTIVAAERNRLPDDHLEQLVRAVGAVTSEDLRRVAQAHLFPRHACLVVAGPVKKAVVGRLLGR
ncbi:MAG TPA: pitrilysin family protein [Planctomycetota bacterium]